MSLSVQTIKNPATKFIEWKSSKKAFQYFDKEAGKVVEIKPPIEFVVLDELSAIKGWSDEFECGIYSNEIHSLQNEDLNVKAFKGGQIVSGKYSEIKDSIKAAGGKFAKSVYAMYEGELVNFQLHGSALSWFTDTQKIAKKESVIKMEKSKEEKKGSNKYYVPVFEYARNMDKEMYEKAVGLDKELQVYLKARKVQVAEEETKTPETATAEEVFGTGSTDKTTMDSVPF